MLQQSSPLSSRHDSRTPYRNFARELVPRELLYNCLVLLYMYCRINRKASTMMERRGVYYIYMYIKKNNVIWNFFLGGEGLFWFKGETLFICLEKIAVIWIYGNLKLSNTIFDFFIQRRMPKLSDRIFSMIWGCQYWVIKF